MLAACLDAVENTHFMTYARLALNVLPVFKPAVPLIFIVANLKWLAAFAAVYAFGLVWQRQGGHGWLLSVLMLLFPMVGVLGVA